MKSKLLPLQIMALATFIVFTLFTYQGNKGFSLWDEGFLWYGAERVMLGEVPIRDFMAYDPGRYYWSAALMNLWGNNGIMALRASVAIFQAIGLFVGLMLIACPVKKQNFLYLLLSAVTLVVWMFPRHKLFDISLSILLIGVLAFLIKNPARRRYFFTGFCVGFAAVFGRNHGMYGIVGSIGVMLWLNIKRTEGIGIIKGFELWIAGVIVGFLPIALMALLVPGFAAAFWESIRFLFEVDYFFSLPVPWPWRVNFALPFGGVIRGVLIGLFFIFTVLFGVLFIIWVVWQKYQSKEVHPTLVAASFLVLPYAHHSYYWPDVPHLAQGIFPLLVGCLVLLTTQTNKVMWTLAMMLCATSLWVMHVYHPGWQYHTSKLFVNIEISGSKLQVDPGTAKDVGLLRNLVNQYASKGQSFIAVPFWPGSYALLDRKSPMWEIYPILPRSQTFENIEIERIKMANPSFALIVDKPLIGRDELRFRNTHPLIHQYIQDHFERLPDLLNHDYQIYKAKNHRN